MTNKKNIVLRADAGSGIGYGHFVRTLALADMLRSDFCVTFATRHPTAYQIEQIQAVCDDYVALGDDHFDEFLAHLTGDEIVVLDNYFFGTDYQKAIKAKGCRLVCIDDMHDKHYVADVVINHALDDPTLFSVEPYTRLCLGLDFALLRRPFLVATPRNKREAGHYVVAFGGVDKNNLTSQIAKVLAQNPAIEKITTIVGDAYAHMESLKSVKGVKIRKNLSAQEICDLFCSVELAVLPTSTVCVEALACGCPVAAGYYVDNQRECYENWARQGIIAPLGDLLGYNWESQLQQNPIKTQCYINPRGRAKRYREIFTALGFDIVDYIDLSVEQSRSVWQARNLFEIRQFMTNAEPFDFTSHEVFVQKLRQDRTQRYWAVFIGDEFVGGYSVVEINGERAKRGIFIVPQYWGSGYADIIEKRMDKELSKLGISSLRAQVQRANLRSLQYHKKTGYRIVDQDDVNFLLERAIEQ